MNHFFLKKSYFYIALINFIPLAHAVMAHAGEEIRPTSGRNTQNQTDSGDISTREKRYGGSFGSFGTFETGEQEIEPDDEPSYTGCPPQDQAQHHLWTDTERCTPRDNTHSFQTEAPVEQKRDD